MSLLTCIQDAMVRVNLAKPASAFSNPDQTVTQFVAFAQDIGDEMAERWPISSNYPGNWVQHADGSFGPRYTADSDISRIDEVTLTSGIIWRWLASKGLDYAEEFRRYEDRFGLAAARAASPVAALPATLLTCIQDAAARLKLPKPNTAFGNTDLTAQQMAAFAQDIGDELSERFFWRSMNQTTTITGDGSTTLWDLPVGFGQLSPGYRFQSNTRTYGYFWGPITNEDLLRVKALYPIIKSGLALTDGQSALLLALPSPVSKLLLAAQGGGALPFTVWRLIGNQVELYPPLSNKEVVTYAFYSNAWVRHADGSLDTRFRSDADTCLIDPKLVTDGIVWRWLADQGKDPTIARAQYEKRLARTEGRENTERVVRMSSHIVAADNWFPGIITDLTGR